MSGKSDEPFDFCVGTIAGIKGLRGEMRIKMDGALDLVEPMTRVKVIFRDTTYDAKVKSIVQENKSVILKLEGFSSREAIEPLIGATIFTQRSQLRPLEEDEWWFGDLIGLEAFTTGGERVGKVSAIIDSGNCLLEIQDGEKTFLVPFVKALVPTVDIKGKRLEIEALPGLLE